MSEHEQTLSALRRQLTREIVAFATSRATQDEAVHLGIPMLSDELPSDLDLVIVDIFLAAGSGLGVLEAAQGMQMRAQRVVLSNFATPEVRRRCLALGAAEVFDKSRDLDALIDYCDKLAEA